jgi:hypothetical protein
MSLITSASRYDISALSDDLYCVLSDTETLGYVHKVGDIYVALSGDNLGHAVEVGQTHSWDRAVTMVASY